LTFPATGEANRGPFGRAFEGGFQQLGQGQQPMGQRHRHRHLVEEQDEIRGATQFLGDGFAVSAGARQPTRGRDRAVGLREGGTGAGDFHDGADLFDQLQQPLGRVLHHLRRFRDFGRGDRFALQCGRAQQLGETEDAGERGAEVVV
jgi:hypothetical protein